MAHACVLHEERERLRLSWETQKCAKLTVPVKIADAGGQTITALSVDCLILPRA